MEFYIFVYKACAVSLYTILVREVDGRFVTLFFNMSQNDLKRPNRILLIFSAIHIKSLAFRFATPNSLQKGRYNVSLECRNFTDEKLYDNFSLQKAGRAFYGKLRVCFGN